MAAAVAAEGNNLELSRKRTMKMVEETAAGWRRPKPNTEARPGREGSSAPLGNHPPLPTLNSQPHTRPTPAPAAATSQPGGRISSGTHPSQTPGRHGAGYTLQDGRPTQQGAQPSSHSFSNSNSTAANSASSYPTTGGAFLHRLIPSSTSVEDE